MNIDEFFSEARRLNVRMLGTPEETRAALDAKDAEIERLTADAERWIGVKEYLTAAADGSMSRNNSEALAAELLAQIQGPKITTKGQP